MSTITIEQQDKIAAYLKDRHIPSGIGTAEEACSIAAINLVLTGELTDVIPDCMSNVIGRWIIVVQDAIPDEMRNSTGWRSLLPLAAGTGRDHEKERLDLILDWMWGTVLPYLQPLADSNGFGEAWKTMCVERTTWAAEAAAEAQVATMALASGQASWVAWAGAAAWAARAAEEARALGAAEAAAEAVVEAVAEAAAVVASAWARAAVVASAWEKFDPVTLLRKLVEMRD